MTGVAITLALGVVAVGALVHGFLWSRAQREKVLPPMMPEDMSEGWCKRQQKADGRKGFHP